MDRHLAIIGAGNVGLALGAALAKAGYDITYGVRDTSRTLPGRVATRKDAAQHADAILLATPWPVAIEAVGGLGDIQGKPLIDCTNPIQFEGGAVGMMDLDGRSAAELIATATGAAVVKTFNQVGADIMGNAAGFSSPPVMFVAGDDPEAKALALDLVRAAGFSARDAGGLRNARALEHLAMLWIDQAVRGPNGRDFVFSVSTR